LITRVGSALTQPVLLVQLILETTGLTQPSALRSEVPHHVKKIKMYWLWNEWSKVRENLK